MTLQKLFLFFKKGKHTPTSQASLGGSVVKNLPANADVDSIPGLKRPPLEKKMATNFSILPWEIPWTEEPDGLQFMGSQKCRTQLSN